MWAPERRVSGDIGLSAHRSYPRSPRRDLPLYASLLLHRILPCSCMVSHSLGLQPTSGSNLLDRIFLVMSATRQYLRRWVYCYKASIGTRHTVGCGRAHSKTARRITPKTSTQRTFQRRRHKMFCFYNTMAPDSPEPTNNSQAIWSDTPLLQGCSTNSILNAQYQ